jgi:hypothetical protein
VAREAFLSAARAVRSPTQIEAAVNVERRRKPRRETAESEKQRSFVFIIGYGRISQILFRSRPDLNQQFATK